MCTCLKKATHISLCLFHWCLKLFKSGFAIAIVACLKNLDVLSLRIDAKKKMNA